MNEKFLFILQFFWNIWPDTYELNKKNYPIWCSHLIVMEFYMRTIGLFSSIYISSFLLFTLLNYYWFRFLFIHFSLLCYWFQFQINIFFRCFVESRVQITTVKSELCHLIPQKRAIIFPFEAVYPALYIQFSINNKRLKGGTNAPVV